MSRTIKLYNMGHEEYKLPMLPNFIRRIWDDFPVPVGELSDAQLKKVGTAWTTALLEQAKKQRKKETA